MSLFGCASDEQFLNELSESDSDLFKKEVGVDHEDYLQGVLEDPYRDLHCDNCNMALHDCQYCSWS